MYVYLNSIFETRQKRSIVVRYLHYIVILYTVDVGNYIYMYMYIHTEQEATPYTGVCQFYNVKIVYGIRRIPT